MGIEADLAQLPPFLGRIVSAKGFLEELALVKSVKGTAAGVLSLGDDLANLDAKVEASNIHLTARYMRLPFPVSVDGGHFIYAGNRRQIAFDGLKISIGKSLLLNHSGAISWSGTPSLQAKSESAKFDLQELHSWLLSFDAFKIRLKDIDSLEGKASIKNLNLKGPLFSPRHWHLKTRGVLSDFNLMSKKLPVSLQVGRGKFTWQGTRIDFIGVDAVLGQSTISGLSAGINLGKSSFFEADSGSAVLSVDEIYPWLMSFDHFQSNFKDFSASGGIVALSDLKLEGPFHLPVKWRYQVNGKLENIVITSAALGEPVTVDSGLFRLTSETDSPPAQSSFKMETANLNWGKNHLSLFGEITSAGGDALLDMTLSADALDWDRIKNILNYIQKRRESSSGRNSKTGLLGSLEVEADKFNFESYTVQPLKAVLSFEPGGVLVAIDEAVVCNIAFRGTVKTYQQTLEIDLVPIAEKQPLAPTVSCVTAQKNLLTGTYDLKGEIRSKSKPDALRQSLAGSVAFSAVGGRIFRLGLLAKLLAILNVTEIYRGEVPDLTGEGFAYRSMTVRAKIKDSRLTMKECAIDGLSMGIACEGDIDIADKKMDLVILVAPFRTVDRIVKFLPLIGHILGGRLISIPFKAKGSWDDPAVTPLHPSAVGSQVLGILERTLKLPITIIQPVLPDSQKKNKQNLQSD
jgi:hypothetical protein